jgi:hypothetical protein
MRTGPFSDTRVIERLNAYFVPVYVVNEDYAPDGPAPAEEKAERDRIYRAALAAGMSTGTVHVYVVAPEGQPLGTLHVAHAARTERLLELLDGVVAELGLKPGEPLAAPRPQSVPRGHEPGSLVLHLVARGLGGGGSWDGTAENWIVYSPEEAALWLPSGELAEGRSWQIEPRLAARLLVHMYPVTENNDVTKNTIEAGELRARVVQVGAQRVLVRLDGRLQMRHDFYHQPDGNLVETDLVGYLEVERSSGCLAGLRLVTHNGRYGGGRFGVAIRMAEAETLPLRQ